MESESSSPSFVYLLETIDPNHPLKKYTYVGATIDVEQRLRKHNGEITGGAVYTTSKVKQGFHWRRIVYVSGFPTWNCALKFEWRWKHMTRRISASITDPTERRLKALEKILELDKSTTSAIPYSEWSDGGPTVIWEEVGI